jgi:hypothetical protein
MIGPANFHLKDSGDVKRYIDSNLKQYARLDNRPGDTAPQRDLVELDSGTGKTQAILHQGLFGQRVLERVQDQAGNVSIREYSKGLFSVAEGYEVNRSATGEYGGSELKFISGWETSFHSYDALGPEQAAQQFNLMEARFQAEFKQA